MILLVFQCFRVILMFVYCIFLVGNKDQGHVRIDAKKPQMDAYSEARQRVFAVASVKFAAAKYDLVVASTKLATMRVSRFKVAGVQPKSTCCSENTAHCKENTLS